MADRWRYDCPEGCSFYIDVTVDSGTGEKAARLMDEHIASRHAESEPDVSSQPPASSHDPVGPDSP